MIGPRYVPVLFLDLDGTVRKGFDELGRFVNGPDDVEVFPEAVTMMRRWRERGGRIVGISNQGGVALGHVTLDAVQDAIAETRRQADEMFDHVTFCSHAPSERCWCRKPSPGMVFAMIPLLGRDHPGEDYRPADALFIGDRPEDEGAAARAGIAFQLAAEWRAEAQ